MLSGAAKEPKVVGAAFSLDLDQLSEPIAGNSGVFIVQLKNKTAATALPSYAGYKASILNTAKQSIQVNTAAAVKEAFEIEDNRNIYY